MDGIKLFSPGSIVKGNERLSISSLVYFAASVLPPLAQLIERSGEEEEKGLSAHLNVERRGEEDWGSDGLWVGIRRC